MQTKIYQELKNITDLTNIIEGAVFDIVDEIQEINAEINEIKKKEGILEKKGA